MVESTRRATSGVVAWLKESICWLNAKKAPAAARAIARCHHEGTTRPSLSSESASWRLEKSPTPSRARIKNGVWSRTRSPRFSGGWALALARTSVNDVDAEQDHGEGERQRLDWALGVDRQDSGDPAPDRP